MRYLVGIPKGRLTRLEKAFAGLPWREVRESAEVKLLAEDGVYIRAQSRARITKERGMRRRRLKRLWLRLHELRGQSLERNELLLKLGAAKKEAGRAYNLVEIRLPAADEPVTPETFGFALRRDRLRRARRREGRYLLRSNLTGEDPATLWRYYTRLTEIEQTFEELKYDLAVHPVFHQREDRIEPHIFVAFVAYCLHVTLKNLARPRAPGLTPRAILEKWSTMQRWMSICRPPFRRGLPSSRSRSGTSPSSRPWCRRRGGSSWSPGRSWTGSNSCRWDSGDPG